VRQEKVGGGRGEGEDGRGEGGRGKGEGGRGKGEEPQRPKTTIAIQRTPQKDRHRELLI